MDGSHDTRLWVVALDVGGTFTDALAFSPASGAMRRAKAYTTTPDPLEGLSNAFARLQLDPESVDYVINGTTVVTNALLTRSGSPTALLTTRGFEDALETGRERRVGGGLHMYDLRQAGPRPLIDRFLRFPIDERISAQGDVVVPLDELQVAAVGRRLLQLGVEAAAVCFLFGYVNPKHERRVVAILEEICPDILVEISSDIVPELREYERTSTTVIDCYTRRTFESYIGSLRNAIEGGREGVSLYVMQSSGGVVPAGSGALRPVQILESGPSAGVIGAAWLGRASHCPSVIALDVGGTTAKACLVLNGELTVVPEFKADGYYPVRVPSIDLAEVGIGGGSIAFIDAGRALRVGPRSAGASPGPACYGRGGIEPTVTDANLVLGRLIPDGFLGGGIRLDVDAARRAITPIAVSLSLEIEAAAAGILRIASAQTAAAVQLISTKRGLDPRDFALVAYGGAGPLQAADVAQELGVPTVIVPQGAATFSAFGMLVANRVGDASMTLMSSAPASEAAWVEDSFRDLEARTLARIELAAGEAELRRHVDARYVGQRWELTVPVPPGAFGEDAWTEVMVRFHVAHQRAYAFHDVNAPVEIVRIGVQAVAPMQKPSRLAFGDAPKGAGPKIRRAWTGQGFEECSVHERSDLPVGSRISGPALINDLDTTIWAPKGSEVSVDEQGSVVIALSGEYHA